MTPIEWIAAVVTVLVFVKFLLLTFKPKVFIKFVGGIIKKDIKILRCIYLVLFLVLAYLLLQELTIVQLWVAMLAGIALVAHSLTAFPKLLQNYLNLFKDKGFNGKLTVDWLIWLGLAGWVLKELFF